MWDKVALRSWGKVPPTLLLCCGHVKCAASKEELVWYQIWPKGAGGQSYYPHYSCVLMCCPLLSTNNHFLLFCLFVFYAFKVYVAYGFFCSWKKAGIMKNLYMGFPGGSEVKASAWNAGGPGLIPGLGRSPGEGNGNPLQYSCLENPIEGGAW